MRGVSDAQDRLTALARSPIQAQAQIALTTLKLSIDSYLRSRAEAFGTTRADAGPAPPDFYRTSLDWQAKAKAIADPTTLVVIDEADRLRIDSLEQIRSSSMKEESALC